MTDSSSPIDFDHLKDRTARVLQAAEVTHKESIALVSVAKALLAEIAKEDDLAAEGELGDRLNPTPEK